MTNPAAADPREAPGLDLSWIVLERDGERDVLACRRCGDRELVPDHYAMLLVQLVCAVFIERHAHCRRVRGEIGPCPSGR